MIRLFISTCLLASQSGAFQPLAPSTATRKSSFHVTERLPSTILPRQDPRQSTTRLCNDPEDLEEQDILMKDSTMKAVEKELGGYDPSERIAGKEINVGDPQIRLKEKEQSVTAILRELAAIQQQGPRKYCILGTRHCSYLHQQIIELL